MAAASSLTQVADEECCTHIADDEFRDIVREGRKFTRYLLYTVEELDAALGETSHTYQSHERHYFKTLLNQWDAHVETARTVITIQAISEALGSLFVGRADHDDISYLIPRKISQKVFPEGHNIPITMVQDVSQSQSTVRSLSLLTIGCRTLTADMRLFSMFSMELSLSLISNGPMMPKIRN
jgi:hypothetical protein